MVKVKKDLIGDISNVILQKTLALAKVDVRKVKQKVLDNEISRLKAVGSILNFAKIDQRINNGQKMRAISLAASNPEEVKAYMAVAMPNMLPQSSQMKKIVRGQVVDQKLLSDSDKSEKRK
jgi:hypothetical protein